VFLVKVNFAVTCML